MKTARQDLEAASMQALRRRLLSADADRPEIGSTAPRGGDGPPVVGGACGCLL